MTMSNHSQINAIVDDIIRNLYSITTDFESYRVTSTIVGKIKMLMYLIENDIGSMDISNINIPNTYIGTDTETIQEEPTNQNIHQYEYDNYDILY